MLELRQVSFAYPQFTAVRDISLTVEPGEFTAIVGKNGSGKTTLTRLMMSLLKPSHGQILLNGQDTKKLLPADLATTIGYVFQNPDRQILRDTVEQEIAYGPQQLGFSPDRQQKNVQMAMEVCGLAELAQAYPRSLSKGCKQRLAIASVLALEPQMLILDEPTSGQDATDKDKMMKLLADLNNQGLTIILVTHDMEILMQYAQRVIVLNAGNMVFDGTPNDLFMDNNPIAAWGLQVPTILHLSQKLAKYGIPATNSADRLCQSLLGPMEDKQL